MRLGNKHLGIYRTDYMAQALHLNHPFDLCVAVPDFMLKSLEKGIESREGPL